MNDVDVDSKFPISLENIQNIINRVHQRYPAVDKYKITLITKHFFECIRYILINGDIISINNFFSKMHLISFSKIRKNKYSRIVKIKLSTPEKIKNA